MKGCAIVTMNNYLKILFSLFCTFSPLFAQEEIATLSTKEVNVRVQIVNVWNSGYQASVSIENKTDHPLSGWKVEFDTEDQKISSIWSAGIAVQEGTHLVITDTKPPWNEKIPAGGSVSFGYVA